MDIRWLYSVICERREYNWIEMRRNFKVIIEIIRNIGLFILRFLEY